MSRLDCRNKLYRSKTGQIILRHWIEQRHSWDYYLYVYEIDTWRRAGNQLWCEFECNSYSKLIGINLTNTGL